MAFSQPLDPTQHSAAMLCDLQCRSSSCRQRPQQQLPQTQTPSQLHTQPQLNFRTTSSPTQHNPSTSPSPTWWTTLFLHLLTLHLTHGYKTLLLALWTLSPSRTARLMQASTLRLTSRSRTSSTIPLLSQSTRALAQHSDAATGLVSALQRGERGGVLRVRAEAEAARMRLSARSAGSRSGCASAEERERRVGATRDDPTDGVGR